MHASDTHTDGKIKINQSIFGGCQLRILIFHLLRVARKDDNKKLVILGGLSVFDTEGGGGFQADVTQQAAAQQELGSAGIINHHPT